MAHEFTRRRRVEFADTDMAGILHFASYFRYMEETEHEFLRSLGASVHLEADGGQVGFPRLAARCDYIRPLRFEDVVDIHLRVVRLGRTSLTYQFLFRRDGADVARGELTASSCRLGPAGRMEPVPLPAVLREALEVSPLEPLVFGPRKRPGESSPAATLAGGG